ncbi:polysaccharide deacetylase family protein [Lysinibacillus irui]|uniref:Polysaccharide deacetylase family protein n=1 Tax=Lysinibacillus irui TaxID=2998077 RepID=A0ABU5NL87_9BACI|nr:polysaccharide deacetylase family protein [Lysinibacillus irui]MEA0555092.1 polysaccharide deacetylase family protein [Lysinibacillus irui]MEA0976807.1 polysaccharide deacetylase family protein [Lysinibacillus irui]MEA1042961.1 polysaccharide deacetylase family protein [Lysinibacillus irui]
MTRKIIVVVFVYIFLFTYPFPIHGYQEQKIPVLMYHHLAENINNNTVISPNNFENQIKALKAEGYHAISVQELYDYFNNHIKLPEKPILITFDDGYLSNYEKAYPILKKYDMHAEIFVIASRIVHTKNDYPKEIAKMNWDQLNEMQDYITIQSHTWDSHYKLTSKNGRVYGAIYGPSYINGQLESQQQFEERVRHDLLYSRQIIKEKLGYEPIAISYPYGNQSPATIQIVKEAGFKMGFVIQNKSVRMGDDLFTLSRITVNGHDTGPELIHKLTTQ